jgi:hypothetical protein
MNHLKKATATERLGIDTFIKEAAIVYPIATTPPYQITPQLLL